jgi:hypothetical protein
MRRVVVWIALASLVAAGAARADGLPVLGVDVGGTGVVAPSGEERFVTVPAGADTVVARVGTGDGRIEGSALLPGTLTIPAVAYDRSAGGLSGDGRTLVLIEPRLAFPRGSTQLAIVDARRLTERRRILLAGDFSFDAVSPRGGLVYLIEYLSKYDPTEYRVRAYDVRAQRLLEEPIVDPGEPDEEMGGTPVSRADGTGGRWAYTLYSRPGKAPFVHALDTAKRTARCIDLDELAGQDASYMRLRLDPGGHSVRVLDRGRPLLTMDTQTFALHEATVAKPDGGSFPWAVAAAGGCLLAVAAVVGVAVVRRRT